MSVGRSSAVGVGTSTAVFALGIGVTVVLTRSLGAEGRGVYFLLVATNALLAEVAKLGVGTAAETLLARGRFSLREVHAVAVSAALAGGAVVAVAASAAYPLLRDNVFSNVPYRYVLVSLLLVAAAVYHGHWNAIMAGLGRVVLLNEVMLALSFVNAALVLLAVGVLDFGIPGFLVAWTATYVAGAAVMGAIAARLGAVSFLPDRAVAAAVLGFGLRVHWGAIAQQGLLRFDVYAVNVLASTQAVGRYSLARTLAERLWTPATAVTASTVASVAGHPPRESALLTARVLRTSLLLMAAAAIPTAAAAPWLVPAVFGRAFATASTPLAILLGGAVLFGGVLVLQNYVVAQLQRPGLLALVLWGQLVLVAPLAVLLIGRWGIVGGAVASTCGYAATFAVVVFLFTRESGIRLREALIPTRADLRTVLGALRRGFAGAARVPAGDAS